MNTKSHLLKLTENERADLQAAAHARNVDVNEAIRAALRQVYGIRHETKPRGKHTRKVKR